MSKVIVIEFITLDGVIQDPDGSDGTAGAGWAFRYGPEPVSGDPFRLSEVLAAGALVLGRRTWEQFAKIWPGRDDPFSAKMNATLVRDDLEAAVRERKREQEVVVMGSVSVTRALMAADLVDEYRLMVFPLTLGAGTRLFADGAAPASLALVSAQPVGPAVRLVYTRAGGE